MHGKIREIIKMQRLIGSLQQMMHVLNSNGYIRHYHVNITLVSFLYGDWKVQNPLPTESYLLTVEPITHNIIYAGGLGGTLIKTIDGGKSWDVQKLKDLVNIRDISFRDSLNGWLIDSEHIYYTNDGGKSWDEVNINADMNTYYYFSIKCFDDIVYLILKPQTAILTELINAKRLVYKSTNNGKTWNQINVAIQGKILCNHFLDEKHGFVYTEETISINEVSNSLYQTKDGGTTWVKQRFPEYNWTQGLFFINEKIGFVGKYRTIDYGNTWVNIFEDYLQQDENIDDIFFADSLNGWAISYIKIFQTTNGGLSWQVVNQQSSYQLTDINFSKNGTGWIIGYAGNIFRKEANSDNWEQLSEGPRNSLNNILVLSRNEWVKVD